MSDTQITIIPQVAAAVEAAKNNFNILVGVRNTVMRQDVDFGIIPSTSKPTLFKAGAEKLCAAFGLVPRFVDEMVIEDFDKPLFYYRRRCELYKDGVIVGTGSGSCNSKENKYSDRWVFDNEARDMGLDVDTLQRKEFTSKKTGKPYFKYLAPNPDMFSLVNTILKMADKRALIAAVLVATGASEFFTQDVEDMGGYTQNEYPQSRASVPQTEQTHELTFIQDGVTVINPSIAQQPFGKSTSATVNAILLQAYGFTNNDVTLAMVAIKDADKLQAGMTIQQAVDLFLQYRPTPPNADIPF